MTATDPTTAEQRLCAAIVANPSDETLRLALADLLEETGRPEAAERVRETSRIRPEKNRLGGWMLWRGLTTNNDVAPDEIVFACQCDNRWEDGDCCWPTEQAGMAAILDAILG
jgi:uncharacterized protein (TIGR02996 family)